MKWEITEDGQLRIERNGVMQTQVCPFGNRHSDPCGYWCPLFGVNDEGGVLLHCAPTSMRMFVSQKEIDERRKVEEAMVAKLNPDLFKTPKRRWFQRK
jgi:hypothetical protein